jgi:predicted class III extradiol MEMO1 family dioxygenase
MSKIHEQTNTKERIAIQVLAGTLGSSMKDMAATNEAQQIAILGIAAIVACLPETAKIPQERLTAALALMAHGRSKDFTEKLARFIATGVATSREIPKVVEKIKVHKATKN